MLVVVLASLFAPGCAGTTWPFRPEMDEASEGAQLRPHHVTAFKDGYPIDIAAHAMRRRAIGDAEFKSRFIRPILEGIDDRARQLVERARAGMPAAPLRILVFVHGGMNGYSLDYERMRVLLGLPGADGASCAGTGPRRDAVDCPPLFPDTSYYPVFINWNSAPFNSLADDVLFIRFGQRNRLLGLLTSPFVLAGRLMQGAFAAVPALWADAENIRDGTSRPGLAGYPYDAVQAVGLSPLHIVTAPALQGLGTPAWDVMKRRADLLVASHLKEDPAGAERGAARTLIDALDERVDRTSLPPKWRVIEEGRVASTVDVEITLLGHSMGAIVLNRLLAAVHSLPVKRIVHLAPASSIDDFEAIVVPYLDHHPTTEFWAFTLDRRDEALEPSGRGVLPAGSLLVWIDELFEKVQTPGHRRFGRQTNLDRYFGRYESMPIRGVCILNFHRDPATQGPAVPRTHGGFANPEFLRPILCTVDPSAFGERRPCGSEERYSLPPLKWCHLPSRLDSAIAR